MKKPRRTQFISYLLAASLLLSFWICVEGCQETVNDFETNVSIFHNIHVDNTEKNSCSIQTAPLAAFSNHQSFAARNFSLLTHQSKKIILQEKPLSVLSSHNDRTFAGLPLQILRQLRI